ncbi:MAG: DedA family protein [Deltaproteobacteria bacterium]|nr:MAG: DedA family protein [Deltaproteobacteria bacterium]
MWRMRSSAASATGPKRSPCPGCRGNYARSATSRRGCSERCSRRWSGAARGRSAPTSIESGPTDARGPALAARVRHRALADQDRLRRERRQHRDQTGGGQHRDAHFVSGAERKRFRSHPAHRIDHVPAERRLAAPVPRRDRRRLPSRPERWHAHDDRRDPRSGLRGFDQPARARDRCRARAVRREARPGGADADDDRRDRQRDRRGVLRRVSLADRRRSECDRAAPGALDLLRRRLRSSPGRHGATAAGVAHRLRLREWRSNPPAAAAPEELALMAAGWWAHQGALPLWAAWVAATAANIVGDTVSYLIGRYFLDRLLNTRLGKRLLSPELRDWGEDFVRRRGFGSIVLGRFLVALRGPVYLAIGASKYPFGRFELINSIVAFIEGAALVWLGYVFGHSVKVAHEVRWIEIAIGILIAAILVTPFLLKRHLVRKGAQSRPPQAA